MRHRPKGQPAANLYPLHLKVALRVEDPIDASGGAGAGQCIGPARPDVGPSFAAWAFAFGEVVELALVVDGEAHRAWGFGGRGVFAVDLDFDRAVAEGGGVALRVGGGDGFSGGQG